MEEYKTIEGFKNYSVSNFGNVKNNKTGEQLKVNECHGYCVVSIKHQYGTGMLYIHRLVAFHFINNYENKKLVDHIDGNTKNNNVYNLRWVSHSENNKNRKINKNNNTGHSGICCINGKYKVCLGSKYLGIVSTIEQAIKLRNDAINDDPEWVKMIRNKDLDELDLFHLQK